MVLEEGKSHGLASTHWRPRKVSGVIHSESKGVKTGG